MSTKRETNWTKWGVISAAVVGFLAVLATFAQPLIANMLSTNSTPTQRATNFPDVSTPLIPPTSFPVTMPHLSPANPTPTHMEIPTATNMTLTVIGGSSANFKLTWNRDSLTMLINGRTDLSSLTLITVNSNGSENQMLVADLFPAFNMDGSIVDPPSCLNLFRSNKLPVLPMACSDQIFKREVDESDVFWYDDVGGLLQNVIVQYGSKRKICSAADQPCIVLLEPV